MNVQVFRQGEVSYFWGRSTELGLDGIGGTLTGELQPGEVVSMEFPLPVSPYPFKAKSHRALSDRTTLWFRVPHPDTGTAILA